MSKSKPTRNDDARSPSAVTRGLEPAGRPAWVHGVAAVIFLYLFVSSIKVMGGGLKAVGHGGWLEDIFAFGDNPIIALMAGVIVTAIVQSSSFTTASFSHSLQSGSR